MKTQVRICFDSNEVPGGARTVLSVAQCGPDVATIDSEEVLGRLDVWVTLAEADPRAPVLIASLKQHGASWLEYHEDHYVEEELDGARLLVMQPNRQCEVSGGVRWGMTYDLAAACPACGTGARQTSAAFVDGDQIADLEGHRAGASIFFHIFVDEGLAADLLAKNLTGLSFRNVYALMRDKRQVKLRWKQLCAAKTLPPMSPRTTGLIRNRACQVCGRNGYFETNKQPPRFVYRASDLRLADDVNMSWENVGGAVLKADIHDSLLSYPWMLVTPKVRRVFRDAGVTELDWIPIRVEETE